MDLCAPCTSSSLSSLFAAKRGSLLRGTVSSAVRGVNNRKRNEFDGMLPGNYLITRRSVNTAMDASASVAVVEEIGDRELRRFQVFNGYPAPLGATAQDGGVNFAVFSGNAASAVLCLISISDLQKNRVTEQIHLDPSINKTGNVWHVFLKGNFKDMLYGYKFDGTFSTQEGHYYDPSRIVLDPYGKAIVCRGEFGALGPDGNFWPQMACTVPTSGDEFDWDGDLPLKHSQQDLIIYEMHVRGFTRHESSGAEFPGTYFGVAEKLNHLKELGVNCIELMPCQEFNELETYCFNSVLGDYKYSLVSYVFIVNLLLAPSC